ncbi:MAG: UDP-N-acetylenolpyruvoylglucosamine reductase [Planctomycetes bacterium]|nr:UDP-N-acetylenolpyruvoylglucosamine reductase [Planctomycetota bacterium]
MREMWPDAFADILTRDAPLAPLTSIRIGGTARLLASPREADETGRLLRALRGVGLGHRVLGGGTNVLVSDGILDDVVIQPTAMDGFEVDGHCVRVGAGLGTPTLVARASSAGLAGVHVLAGVPGQVGGALAMNAGTRHGELAEVVERVLARDRDGDVLELDPGDLAFGYRHAAIPEGAVICGAVLRLRVADDVGELRRTVGRYLKEKNAAQPTRTWNFGCMFKNPPGDLTAGVLLDRAGMKGLARGGAVISPVHANFVENVDDAAAADVQWLLEQAEEQVWSRCAVRLEREVRVWAASPGVPQ